MAPRRNKKRSNHPRVPTQFGTLDTTPTSRHFQSPQGVTPGHRAAPVEGPASPSQAQPVNTFEEFEDGLDDVDLVALDGAHAPRTASGAREGMAWSEAGSLTRRSSPIVAGETPRDLWVFDEEDAPMLFTSPASGKDKLPDTMPLPTDLVPRPPSRSPAQERPHIDFSETASTIRRSSPVTFEPPPTLDFEGIPTSNVMTLPETLPLPQQSRASQPSWDNNGEYMASASQVQHGTASNQSQRVIDDSIPCESSRKEAVEAEYPGKSSKRSLGELLESELASDDEEPPLRSLKAALPRGLNCQPEERGPREGLPPAKQSLQQTFATSPQDLGGEPKSKKRKQRAKTPIQFDEETQRVKEVSRPKQKALPARLPIVSALRESVQPSSSPPVRTKRKTAPKGQSKTRRKPKQTAVNNEKSATTVRAHVADVSNDLPDTSQQLPQLMPKKTAQEVAAPRKTQVLEDTMVISSGIPHIVLSSDSDESSFSRQSSSYSPAMDTANTTMNDVTGEESLDFTDFKDRGSCSTHQPNRNSNQQALSPSKGASASATAAESRQIIQGSQECKRPRQVVLDAENQINATRKSLKNLVVKPQDFNKREKQTRTSLEEMPIVKPHVTVPTQGATTQPPTKACRLPRHFSISEAGSPVPFKGGHAPLVDQSASHQDNSPGTADYSSSQKLQYGLMQSRQTNPSSASERTTLLGSTLRGGRHFGVPSMESNTRRADRNYRQDQVHDAQHGERLPPQFATMNRDMHNHILAALQGQDTDSTANSEQDHKKGSEQGKGTAATGRQPKLPKNTIAEQLHGIVDMMICNLQSKEKSLHRAAEAYRKNGLGCIEKIEQKYDQERKILAEHSTKDSDTFIGGLERAKAAIARNNQERQDAVSRVTENLATRRMLYQRATTSMRSLHRQLLEGNTLEDAI